VSRFDRPVLRTAALAALLLALGVTLSACGRKGPLDPPPASLAGPPQSAIETDAEGRPIAPPGQKKRLPIDWLLD
jgi:predicted small lipoprotein YifL